MLKNKNAHFLCISDVMLVTLEIGVRILPVGKLGTIDNIKMENVY